MPTGTCRVPKSGNPKSKKPEGKPSGLKVRPNSWFLWNLVGGLGIISQRAGRLLVQIADGISPPRWTPRDVPVGVELNIGLHIIFGGRGVATLVFIERPRRFCPVYQAQIADTTLGLRRRSRVDEVRD